MAGATVSFDSVVEYFESLPDPRHTRNRRHLLVDVIVIADCLTGDADGSHRTIAIDGKTMRRSHDRAGGLGPLHLGRCHIDDTRRMIRAMAGWTIGTITWRNCPMIPPYTR